MQLADLGGDAFDELFVVGNLVVSVAAGLLEQDQEKSL